jgi:RNA polymerase sigma-70 factor (ECF subfamily)
MAATEGSWREKVGEPAGAPPDEARSLVAACLAGGPGADAAFTRLVTAFRDRVVSVAAGMVGDVDQAEDVAQAVFLKVHANLAQFRFESRFDAWLYRITVRTSVDHRRRFWWRRRVGLETLPEPLRDSVLGSAIAPAGHGSPEADPETQILRAEQVRAVHRALGEIPEALRAAVVLKDMAELPYEEIGRILGCPLGTVESRIHRGRQALRKKLKKVLQT